MTSSTSTYKPEGSGNRGFILTIVAICLIGAAGLAFVIGSGAGSDDPDDVAQNAPVSTEGDALPAMPSIGGVTNAGNDEAVGMVAPTLTGTDFDGNEITIEADGTPKAVYFLAHWCAHCQAEAPRVQELIDNGSQPEGLDLYAVSTSADAGRGNYPPSRWLENEVNWTVPTIRDDEANSALLEWGAGGFPYVVYLDGDNQVVGRSSGELDAANIAAAWQLTAGATAS